MDKEIEIIINREIKLEETTVTLQSINPKNPITTKAVSVKPIEEAPKTEELKKEDKKVEAKAEKQTSEKK